MTDYELLEIDRIAKIQSINKQYDLENNAYLSFSGGKDSTVLHYLLDLALPNNKIPRVFINTGIEYLEIVKFVKGLAANDDRFVLISPTKNIKNILEEYGYPFKSKEHSQRIYEFNRNSKAPFLKRYITGIDKNGNSTIFKCPKKLLYQFEDDSKMFGISIVISTKENINYILGLYSLFDENGNKRENVSIEIIRSCQDIPSGAKHFIVNPIKTTIISYEDVEEMPRLVKQYIKF